MTWISKREDELNNDTLSMTHCSVCLESLRAVCSQIPYVTNPELTMHRVDRANPMIKLSTSQGLVEWSLGSLATAVPIFLYGYCSNFASVLASRRPTLQVCVLVDKSGTPDHYLCKDDISFLDIRGRLTREQVLEMCSGGDIYEDIEIEELEQNWEQEWDYLAESIIDEYLRKWEI